MRGPEKFIRFLTNSWVSKDKNDRHYNEQQDPS